MEQVVVVYEAELVTTNRNVYIFASRGADGKTRTVDAMLPMSTTAVKRCPDVNYVEFRWMNESIFVFSKTARERDAFMTKVAMHCLPEEDPIHGIIPDDYFPEDTKLPPPTDEQPVSAEAKAEVLKMIAKANASPELDKSLAEDMDVGDLRPSATGNYIDRKNRPLRPSAAELSDK